MARPRSELHEILEGLDGVEKAYFQAPTSMVDPCIIYEPSTSDASFADNVKYVHKKGYSVIVVDRNPDSLIPDQVEGLNYSRFERFYRANGLNHFVFRVFF